jgi:alanyl-tRNA synthetase
MKYLSAIEIRQIWLSFFKEKDHLIETSSPLIPQNDKTLLWINAGVAPLKKYFDGREIPPHPRLTNVQKCIRTNDIDNVGKTARHHTFFEMLGNFSIGDYFKQEAIAFAYELLTSPRYFDMPKDKLYMTYYPSDQEAHDRWIELGIEPSHLIPRDDNFWEIGPGPCGPDTEIYFDRGETFDQRGPELILNDIENERYIEIWNVVFSQYNATENVSRDNYKELPNKNIDTGAGLERFACVLQGTQTNFETDLFLPIIKHIEVLSSVTYEGQMAFKVIADHIKALVIATSDGAVLSNEGRGYVLRRLLRRAVKYGLKLHFKAPFLFELIPTVIEMMGTFYPNLMTSKDIVTKIIKQEEIKFFETIHEGEKLLAEAFKEYDQELPKELVFKLYDTYGFPFELTEEYALERGIKVDQQGFKSLLEAQKARSRESQKQQKGMFLQDEAYLSFKEPSLFIGYHTLQTHAKVIKVFDDGIVLDQTPFYAESGGQVSDQGTINGLDVLAVKKLPNKQFLHVIEGEFEEGEEVLALVDASKRHQTEKNHSAAHLFHQSIKEIYGSHCNQQGSQITPKTWRFDFNHYETVSDQLIIDVENMVNHYIQTNPLEVSIYEASIEEAKQKGAMALFGEKYGNVVRVVDMGWSIELCGGTHVNNTKEIEKFAIVSYQSIGSGIYRMEGITGANIKQQMRPFLKTYLDELALLKDKAVKEGYQVQMTPPLVYGTYQDIVAYRQFIQQVKIDLKQAEKLKQDALEKNALKGIDLSSIQTIQNISVLNINNYDAKLLKALVDQVFDQLSVETLLVINQTEEKVSFVAKSKQDQALDIVKKLANLSNGSGGGKPSFAQGGTQHLELFEQALQAL